MSATPRPDLPEGFDYESDTYTLPELTSQVQARNRGWSREQCQRYVIDHGMIEKSIDSSGMTPADKRGAHRQLVRLRREGVTV